MRPQEELKSNTSDYLRVIGLSMAIITFCFAGTSGGYYLMVSEFGTNQSFDRMLMYKESLALALHQDTDLIQDYAIETDAESIGRGKDLFNSKCGFCHHSNSTETIVGPGLKGILKKNRLPYSRKKANPENIIKQLKTPVNRMPSFEYLNDQEISDIIAYLNTL